MLTIKVVAGLLWTLAHIAAQGCNNGTSNPTTGVIQRLVGKKVTTMDTTTDSNPSLIKFNIFNGGQINQGSDLNCDFSSQCCWKDESFVSSVKWQIASGSPEQPKMENNFGTTTMPTGNWLVAGAETWTGDSATFVSCSITCTTGPITVSLRHWTTKNVVIKVCTQPDGSNSPQNCQTLPTASPGPDTVTLPAVTQLSDLVIVASGFSEKAGSVAMIDDIQVNAQVCPTTTTSTTTTTTTMITTTTATVCKKVQCNFESSSACSYTDAMSTGDIPGVTQKWQIEQGQYQNKATGIDKAGEGQYYMATYLYPNDAAALETNVQFDQDRVVRFLAYRATEGIDLQACCDNVQSCIYNMGKNVQIADFRNWRTVSVSCPAGTKKVIMYAKNSGKNQGAVGLDNIQVLIPSGGSPDSATTPAC